MKSYTLCPHFIDNKTEVQRGQGKLKVMVEVGFGSTDQKIHALNYRARLPYYTNLIRKYNQHLIPCTLKKKEM